MRCEQRDRRRSAATRRGMLVAALALSSLLGACAATAPRSHALNPLGWPSKGLLALGHAAADSEQLLLRETGRLLMAVGELIDTPALLVEGVTTLSGDKIAGSGKLLVVGTGGTVTAALNLPFFMTGGATVDIGRLEPHVNDALEYMEELPPERWRAGPEDDRPWIFPPGTRVRASGRNLVWCFPDGGEILQTAEVSRPFEALLEVTGNSQYTAQERTWGMVIPDLEGWKQMGGRQRVVTVIHEFLHQWSQQREDFLGWSTVYWPAYTASYVIGGYRGHWAESGTGAKTINRALAQWY